jgi:hypothetical protein
MDNRQPIFDTWHDLNDVIGDFERGRVQLSSVEEAFKAYREACTAAGEPYFPITAIMSDKMLGIPWGYPTVKPELPAIYKVDFKA